MSFAVTANDPTLDRRRSPLVVGSTRYVEVDTLARGLRADIAVGVVEGARSLDDLVVIKRFHPDAAVVDWTWLVAELELASRVQCDHSVRVLAVGLEPSRCFLLQEYLEGATLRTCLDWSRTTHARWPTPVVARILSSILEAVQAAHEAGQSPLSRALVHGSVAAEDVFLTYDGQVKLLGFKSPMRQPPANETMGHPTAIDALLEQQLTPELSVLLRRLPGPGEAQPHERSEGILPLLRRWRRDDLPADGSRELARLLRTIDPQGRAGQAMRLVAAFAQLAGRKLKFRDGGEREDPPQSGYRRIGAPTGGQTSGRARSPETGR